MFLDRVIHFVRILGDQVKGRSPKKVKLLNELAYVLHVKEHVLSFNMILISFPQRVPRPGYPFRKEFWRSGKGSLREKAKIVDRGS